MTSLLRSTLIDWGHIEAMELREIAADPGSNSMEEDLQRSLLILKRSGPYSPIRNSMPQGRRNNQFEWEATSLQVPC